MNSTIDPEEVAKFGRLANQWWDAYGPFAPLHRFNPIRLQFIRDVAAEHFGRDRRALRSFQGLSLADIGCGGGLLSEPLARMGFEVLGCDAAAENVAVAESHASEAKMPIAYRCTTAESLVAEGASFDLVLAMEIVEHVADREAFVRACVQLLRPAGILFLGTINRTLKSMAFAKITAEYVLRWLPPGTHDWNRFMAPEELRDLLEEAGGQVIRIQGMTFDVLRGEWQLSNSTDVNYALAAVPVASSP